MERYLRPERLEIDPNSTDAAKTWTHWFKTFKNFVDSPALNTAGFDKLSTLINFIGPSIYEYIADSTSYEEAIEALEAVFVKPKNEIFARHILSTKKQALGQSLDQYLQQLKVLAKDCNFKAVTADICRDEAIRDAFISGLKSNAIRQRLLEKTRPTLQTAFDTARSLEMAEQQSQSYQSPTAHAAASSPATTCNIEPDANDSSLAASAIFQKCYLCGYRKHPRSKCPAREATCDLCGKWGHFQKACQSSKKKTVATSSSLFSTMTAAAEPESLKRAMIKVTVNGKNLTSLVDSGSSESYIDAQVAKDQKWFVIPSTRVISMASLTLKTQTQGHCNVKLTYKSKCYENVRLSLLPNACS